MLCNSIPTPGAADFPGHDVDPSADSTLQDPSETSAPLSPYSQHHRCVRPPFAPTQTRPAPEVTMHSIPGGTVTGHHLSRKRA